ncbi:MAG: hypothetical protein E7E22_08270 [Actinomyces sp.]|nr:hypothetical protein [Actinomyces sp.]
MITFINNAGAAIVSRKIVERTGNIKWLTREEPLPACIGIYDLPIGSDIQLVVEPDGRRRWFDNKTEKEISFR